MKKYMSEQGRAQLWLLMLVVTLSISCGDDQSAGPSEGAISVQSQTSGVDFDPDGYLVSVNNGQGLPIGHQAKIYVAALEPGTYTVALEGITDNCTVPAEQNPQDAAVVAGDTVEVEFDITCETAAPPDDGGGGPVP